MRLDPPLDPTSPQARQWLEDELRKGIYHEQKGLLQRIWDWLNELIFLADIDRWVAMDFSIDLATATEVRARASGDPSPTVVPSFALPLR